MFYALSVYVICLQYISLNVEFLKKLTPNSREKTHIHTLFHFFSFYYFSTEMKETVGKSNNIREFVCMVVFIFHLLNY